MDAYPHTFFVSNNTVYILDGSDFYSWDGTTFKVVEGYVPTVYSASPPHGAGQLLEGINYITGKKKMWFSATGTDTIYQLMEYGIDSVDSVTVNAVVLTNGTDYTVDLAAGTVTFVTPPQQETTMLKSHGQKPTKSSETLSPTVCITVVLIMLDSGIRQREP